MSKRIAYFIEISNIYLTLIKQFGTPENPKPHLDYRKLLHYFDGWGKVTIARAYGAYSGRQSIAFIKTIENAGFTPICRPPRKLPDGTSKNIPDVEIAIDMVRFIDDYDVAILGSADGDFESVVRYLIERNKRVFIFAANISQQLRGVATESFELDRSFLKEKKDVQTDGKQNVSDCDNHDSVLRIQLL